MESIRRARCMLFAPPSGEQDSWQSGNCILKKTSSIPSRYRIQCWMPCRWSARAKVFLILCPKVICWMREHANDEKSYRVCLLVQFLEYWVQWLLRGTKFCRLFERYIKAGAGNRKYTWILYEILHDKLSGESRFWLLADSSYYLECIHSEQYKLQFVVSFKYSWT